MYIGSQKFGYKTQTTFPDPCHHHLAPDVQTISFRLSILLASHSPHHLLPDCPGYLPLHQLVPGIRSISFRLALFFWTMMSSPHGCVQTILTRSFDQYVLTICLRFSGLFASDCLHQFAHWCPDYLPLTVCSLWFLLSRQFVPDCLNYLPLIVQTNIPLHTINLLYIGSVFPDSNVRSMQQFPDNIDSLF